MDIKHLPRLPGTFIITCVPTKQTFVGFSGNLRICGKVLRSSLRHGYACSRLLQEAWNEHGEENFVISIHKMYENSVQAELATKKHELNIRMRPVVPRDRWRDKNKCKGLFRTKEESIMIYEDIVDGMSDTQLMKKWDISLGNLHVRRTRVKQMQQTQPTPTKKVNTL